jgi:hypothetical protein
MFLCIGLKASESVVYTFYISHTDSEPYKHTMTIQLPVPNCSFDEPYSFKSVAKIQAE